MGHPAQRLPDARTRVRADAYARRRPEETALYQVVAERPSLAPSEDVFAYLSGESPATERILEALTRAKLTGRIFVRSPRVAQARMVAGSRYVWLDAPEPMAAALDRARMLVHHAGMLATEEAIAAGTPQLVAPNHLEGLLTARALLKLGVGRVIRPAHGPGELATLLAASAADAEFAASARALSTRFWQTAAPTDKLADRLLHEVLPE